MNAKVVVGVFLAVLGGAIVGGLIGRYAVPKADPNASASVPTDATCTLITAPGNNVQGTLALHREDDIISITGTIQGLSAGKHGFHVHQTGSVGNACKDAQGHFNPFGEDHGGPDADVRHVGDLGNIIADSNQQANVDIQDSVIKFSGDASILGRAIVVHADEDDLGLGGHDDSKTTGHAGARIACCVIGTVNH